MVLADLGNKISGALRNMSNSLVIDNTVVDQLLKEIGNALFLSDVNINMVQSLKAKIKGKIDLEALKGINTRKYIQKVVFDELCALLDPGVLPKEFKRHKQSVLMLVGLQGNGKTTTVSKLALHYKRKGFLTGVVCADTFRAGAFDQLKQNAAKIKVPFYGSYTEADPVKIAEDGVREFKKNRFEIIIVDTSGRHKQEESLFEEMKQVATVITPDQIIFVMDGSIGQAAFDQAQAFSQTVDVGAVIITKLDGHAKGGGAISAVAATKSPITFIGTGEHMDDLEPFHASDFVSKLLGLGAARQFAEKIQSILPGKDEEEKWRKKIKEGSYTLRDMNEQFKSVLKLGPINKVVEMLPGMGNFLQNLPPGVDSNHKLQSYLTIMDSMNAKELDDPKWLTKDVSKDSRIKRIARGSGRPIRDVHELLTQFQTFQKIMGGMKNLKVNRSGQVNPRNMGQLMGMLPPQIQKQMGAGGLNSILKQMGDMGFPMK